MAVAAAEGNGSRRSWHSLLYNPKLRQFIYQALTVIFIVWLVWYASSNAAQNLEKANMRASLTFLNGRAGFDIAQTPIQYSSDSTYLRALTLGLINTLIVAACGIVTATIIGLLVGMGRLSHNWLIAKLSTVYVEIFRNIPPLLVIFFWYKGVLSLLPDVKKAMSLPLSVYVSNRGVYMPAPIFGAGIWTVPVACAVGIIGAIIYTRWANKRQLATGKRPPVLLVNLALIIGLPLLAFAIAGFPVTFDIPVLGKFNMNGGTVVGPEFLSLYMALSFYTAAFIAEIVRSGIRGVSKGHRKQHMRWDPPRPDDAACRPATGIADHHSTADIAIPEPDEELVAGRRHRVCGLGGRGRDDPQPVRPLDRDHRHLDGDLCFAEPDHVAVHELVQRPYGIGGALRWPFRSLFFERNSLPRKRHR